MWEQGKMNGDGIYQWIDGRKYNGQYKLGQKHGNGEFTFADGRVYKGTWEEDEKVGKGVFKDKSGRVIVEGTWDGGSFVTVDMLNS